VTAAVGKHPCLNDFTREQHGAQVLASGKLQNLDRLQIIGSSDLIQS